MSRKQPRGRISQATAAQSPTQIRREFQRRTREEEAITQDAIDTRTFEFKNGRLCLRRGPKVRGLADLTGGRMAREHVPEVEEQDASSPDTASLSRAVNALRDGEATLASKVNEILNALKQKGLLEE